MSSIKTMLTALFSDFQLSCRNHGEWNIWRDTRRSIYQRKYILQITQPSQYRYTQLQHRFAVISEAASIAVHCPLDQQLCRKPTGEPPEIWSRNINNCAQEWPRIGTIYLYQGCSRDIRAFWLGLFKKNEKSSELKEIWSRHINKFAQEWPRIGTIYLYQGCSRVVLTVW